MALHHLHMGENSQKLGARCTLHSLLAAQWVGLWPFQVACLHLISHVFFKA